MAASIPEVRGRLPQRRQVSPKCGDICRNGDKSFPLHLLICKITKFTGLTQFFFVNTDVMVGFLLWPVCYSKFLLYIQSANQANH
jgi:hypothetical protein